MVDSLPRDSVPGGPVELRLLSGVACRGRDVTSPRLRGLLALLAGEPRAGVSVVRLVEGLWPGERPENPVKALQVVVSRARSQLGADVIAGTPTGYRIGLEESAVDASAVLLAASASARRSRDGDHAGALAHAEDGLALFDGPPEPGDGDDPLAVLRADRVSTYWTLARARALALARLGRHAEGFEALAGAALEYPRDEEVLAELLRCEAATAGPAAALARYESYRRSLRDELGTDPGGALQRVQQELLRDEAPAVRRGVAHEPNPLLGRAGDLAAVLDLLRASRVTSIVGPGGLGKTRLANTVAREAPQRAVHYVPLAGVARDEDVAGEVASVLGVGESPPAHGRLGRAGDVASAIAEVLGPGPVLLVLDNCEHVVDGAAGLAGALVSMTRDLRILTTSRAPLGLSSESVYPLPALDPPTSAELFRQRARSARPGVELPPGPVEELCRHLDGLPLAIELAAARVRVMTVPEITRGLGDRFALLRGNARDAPSRHRTMHAVVDWSWGLLSPSGREAMRLLSVLPAGFTAAAARHLLGGDALEILQDLVDQSLLEPAGGGPETRFRMLESVREFSAAHRDAEGDTDRAVSGMLTWAREFGTAHHEALFGSEPFAPLARARVELDNLQRALRHGLARRDAPAVAAVAAVLGGVWTLEAAYSRMIVLAEETAGLLSRFRPGPEDVDVARTALALSVVTTVLFKGPQATRALVALRRLPPAPHGSFVNAMATVAAAMPEILDPDRAGSGRPGLEELCAGDDPLVAALANCVAGYIREREGDVAGALAATEDMTATPCVPDIPWCRLLFHSRLGELLMQLDQGDRALHHLRISLDLLEKYEWPDMFGLMWAIGSVHLSLGDYAEAERWLDRSLVHGPDEAFGTAAFNLGARAEIAFGRGDVETGLALWREAVDRLAAEDVPGPRAGLDPWTLEAHCVTVVAHARHGRVDLVEDLVAGLPARLAALLNDPPVPMPSSFMDLPVSGGLLLALAMVDLARPGAAQDVRTRAARAIALAQRLHHVRNFQPTMSTALISRAARDADGPAYSDAVPEYAGLGRAELRAIARELARGFAPV
ncbi:BTAD domain-containing putative transcriptional regulator [Actinomadura sp. WMMA1423]|uniref:ATP-binding protein n=1 Tax=Actinomadura sp. WMMA1423 TaxID=2591108 RepID=UPI0011469492|nr:BTAD domain-containing putative transcriptional regulator [Actinomadura sp. WMMA1423]